MLKKMGLSRDADYQSRWVVPVLQLLLTFLTPTLREVRRRKEGVKSWTIAARFCRSHISMSRSVLNWHRWQGCHKTIKSVHLWVYLQNLHHLVYSVVFTSIYHVFFSLCMKSEQWQLMLTFFWVWTQSDCISFVSGESKLRARASPAALNHQGSVCLCVLQNWLRATASVSTEKHLSWIYTHCA